MRFWPIWLILCVALAGCDGTAGLGGDSGGTPQEPAVAAGPPPTSISAGSLALYRDLDNDEAKVRVGDEATSVERIFPSPVKGIVATSLPKGLSPEDYMAKGWELGDGTEGAGFISNARTKEVVAAIVRQVAADSDTAAAIVEAYKKKFRPIDPIAKTYGVNTYAFWEDGDNRLMILESPGKKGTVQLTLALGIKEVLTFLRADPEHARIDAGKLSFPAPATNSASSGS